jgi:glycosyltransferase involved in cell wall biosynthesis
MGTGSATTAPRVSIVIPVYNATSTLPLTLRSIFGQTFTDWELILVDDGSTDGSVELMRSIDDDRVRVYVDGENKTPGPRHNEMTRLARAQLVARMDNDDVMHPDRLQKQVEYMDAHPEVDMVGTGAYSVDSELRIAGKRGSSRLPSSEFQVGLRGLFIHPTVMGRTTWFRDNPYDEAPQVWRITDMDLWFRTFTRSHFGLLSEPLLFYEEDMGEIIDKLRETNRARLWLMFRGHGEVRRKRLSLRLAIAAVICLKMLYYELCWALGARQYLIDRRNQPLDAKEAEQAYAILERAKQCRVPGLD